MFNTSIRASLLLLVAALTISTSSGQPRDAKKEEPKIKGERPDYTAFPDLKPAGIELPPLPAVAADAPPLRKVQYEQAQAGLAYLAHTKEVIRVGNWDKSFFREYLLMSEETFRVAAELEDKPAKRVPWYEARVRGLKEFEQFTELRVRSGTEPPQGLPAARFARLQAEADLLKLKAEVEKAGGK